MRLVTASVARIGASGTVVAALPSALETSQSYRAGNCTETKGRFGQLRGQSLPLLPMLGGGARAWFRLMEMFYNELWCLRERNKSHNVIHFRWLGGMVYRKAAFRKCQIPLLNLEEAGPWFSCYFMVSTVFYILPHMSYR